MKRVICFDLWGTLIRSAATNGKGYAEALVKLGVPVDQIAPFVRQNLMVKPLSYDEMVSKLFDHFHLMANLDHQGFSEACSQKSEVIEKWQADNQAVSWIANSRKILKQLRRQEEQLVLVTNITWPAWETARLLLEGIFQRFFLSYEQGIAKPHPKVWQTVRSWFPDVPAGQFWMIGNNEERDLYVPMAMGWKTALVRPDGSDIPGLAQKILSGGG